MTDTASCARLNDLLVDLGRSLLQYAGEAWPWTSTTDAGELRSVVSRLGAFQRESVAAVAHLLDGEGHPIDFGVYPDEYTSLHYVSLRYLLDQLIVNEQALVEECRAVTSELEPNSPAADLLREVSQREAAILSELQSLRQV
ncbi:MAG: hypothetical protein KDA75_14105 [Planctomycetaceae bacterium]|nr:hypothetical protein [Planctomycetaceae bacterium]